MRLSPGQIIETVAVLHHVEPDELTGPSRAMPVVHARHAAMLKVRQLTDLSLPEIGREFGRDHTTVLHGIRAAAERAGVPVPPTPVRERRRRPRKHRPRCKVSGCRKVHSAHGLCAGHRQRQAKWGDVMADVPLGDLPKGRPDPGPFEQCEVCGRTPLGGSRWCGVGRCVETVRPGRWSWSQQRSAA